MTSSEKPRQFRMKSQLILIAWGLSVNNQKLVDLLFQPLTRKHEIRGDVFSKSLSIYLHCTYGKRVIIHDWCICTNQALGIIRVSSKVAAL